MGGVDAPVTVVPPAHEFPLSNTLDPRRRRELVGFAGRGGTPALADDQTAEFRLDRQPVGALQALAPDHVVHAGSG